jgi:hypothetical protein
VVSQFFFVPRQRPQLLHRGHSSGLEVALTEGSGTGVLLRGYPLRQRKYRLFYRTHQ